MKVILKNYLSNSKMIDKLLIFDLTGKFACWKKFYSNSSSFTYEIPTRTQLIGILASILEMPKDSYYEKLSSENCKISLSLKSSLKKKFHCLNYFMEPNKRKYTQVRLEILSPTNILDEQIVYRIYVYIGDSELFNTLIDKVKNKSLGCGVSLGQQQFKGDIEFVGIAENIKIIEGCNKINTICNLKNIEGEERVQDAKIITEKMPMDFSFKGSDDELNTNILNREILRMSDIVYSKDKMFFEITTNFKKALAISYSEHKENLCFYEEEF